MGMQTEGNEMSNRWRKNFRYRPDRPSLHLTNLAVEYFARNVTPKLGHVDLHFAAALTRRARLSPCTLMLAFVYVDRLRTYNPQYLQTISSSDLFLVSVIIASKFMNDEGEEDEILNDEWASSAYMDTKDVNKLEREFLAALDWHVFVSQKTFEQISEQTEMILAFQNGQRNGWFSYTDLNLLSQQIRTVEILRLIMDRIFMVTLVCAVTYTAGILTMVGSTYTVNTVMNSVTRPQTDYSPCNNTITSSEVKSCFNEMENLVPEFLEAQMNFTQTQTENLPSVLKCRNSSCDVISHVDYKFVQTLWRPNFGTVAAA